MLESSVNIDEVHDILRYVVNVNEAKSCIIRDSLVNIITTWSLLGAVWPGVSLCT